MKGFKKIFTTTLCTVLVLASSVTAFAGTSYANYFKSWKDNGSYKCYFSFIGAHEIQSGEAYCTEKGKHIKQAYAIAYNSKESSGRKYSTAATSTSDSKRRTTPTASIEARLFYKEYTKYGYTLFK